MAIPGGTVDEFDAIIKRIDPNSRLRMVEEGARPANPFPNEKAFEESLEISYYPGEFIFQLTFL